MIIMIKIIIIAQRKIKESEKREKCLDLGRDKKTMEHEGDSCNRCA